MSVRKIRKSFLSILWLIQYEATLPNVIKTIWGTVWFTFLRNLKKIFLTRMGLGVQQHRSFSSSSDFLLYPILSLLPCFLRADRTLLQSLRFSVPHLKYQPRKGVPVPPWRQSRTLFHHLHGICHYLKLSYLFIWSSLYCLTSAPSLEYRAC